MMMSPGSTKGSKLLIKSSTGFPAMTSNMTRRGFFSFEIRSSIECAPIILLFPEERLVNCTYPGAFRIVDSLTLCFIVEEAVDLGHSSIEGTNFEAMVGNIHDQVLAHDGQTNEAKIGTGRTPHRFADIEAGETAADVSNMV